MQVLGSHYQSSSSASPVPSTRFQALFLAKYNQLAVETPTDVSEETYQANVPALQVDNDPEEVRFTHTFSRAELPKIIGYPKVILHMSCTSHGDLDVFDQVPKASKDEDLLRTLISL